MKKIFELELNRTIIHKVDGNKKIFSKDKFTVNANDYKKMFNVIKDNNGKFTDFKNTDIGFIPMCMAIGSDKEIIIYKFKIK